MPIWIADYVLAEYGEGAVMGVPAHDARDFAFAEAMGLPIRTVVASNRAARPTPADDERWSRASRDDIFTEHGTLIRSGDYTGMTSTEAAAGHRRRRWRSAALASPTCAIHLRDWLVSRQRYWGTPIPIIYCPEHGAVAVPEDQLPVILPEVDDYRPTGTGVSPLARPCRASSRRPAQSAAAPRAARPTSATTSWTRRGTTCAIHRATMPHSRGTPTLTRKWLPVDMYVGGAEHSVLHLLYARFITRALHDLGHLPFAEPFTRFRANGMITLDGAKMSKSRMQRRQSRRIHRRLRRRRLPHLHALHGTL